MNRQERNIMWNKRRTDFGIPQVMPKSHILILLSKSTMRNNLNNKIKKTTGKLAVLSILSALIAVGITSNTDAFAMHVTW